MHTLFRIFSALPLWLAHGLGNVLGWLAWLLSPTYRRRFAANSAQAGYSFEQVSSAIGHAGRMVAELPRLWLKDTAVNAVHGAEVVEAAWARGKGIVFLTPHLGCFELSVQSAATLWSAQRLRIPRYSKLPTPTASKSICACSARWPSVFGRVLECACSA